MSRISHVIALVAVAACAGAEDPTAAPDAGAPDDAASSPDAPPADPIGPGLDRLNAIRALVGVAPVVRIASLDEGCRKHVAYMVAEQKVVHDEDEASPHFSQEGQSAGLNANLAGNVTDVSDAVDRWIASLYHRLPLLDPGVEEVGVAFEAGYACLDLYSEYDPAPGHAPVPWPAPGQADVATTFENAGAIDPLPSGYDPPVGPIISLQIAPDQEVGEGFGGTLSQGGVAVEAFVRLPNDPEDPYREFQGNTVTLIPRKALLPLTEYRVIMSGTVGGAELTSEWTFTTAP